MNFAADRRRLADAVLDVRRLRTLSVGTRQGLDPRPALGTFRITKIAHDLDLVGGQRCRCALVPTHL